MSVDLPLGLKPTHRGIITNPKLPVEILTNVGWIPYLFLLDTGADFTMVPRRIAEMAGIDMVACPKGTAYGLEGGGVEVYRSVLRARIAEVELDLRCSIGEDDRMPFLLGRADFLERFEVSINVRERKIRLTPL